MRVTNLRLRQTKIHSKNPILFCVRFFIAKLMYLCPKGNKTIQPLILHISTQMTISNEAKVGILTIVALGLLIFGYNFLKGQKLFSRQNYYFAEYSRVDGLLTSNPVLLNGFQVGTVSQVYMKEDNPNRMMVQFTVNNRVKLLLNSKAIIVSAGLLGDKALSVEQWTPTTEEEKKNPITAYYASGDTLIGQAEVGLTEMAKKELLPIKDRADSLMQSLDSTLHSLNKILTSTEVKGLISNLSSSSATLNSTLKKADNLTGNLNAFAQNDLPKVSTTMSNITQITNDLKNNTGKIDALMNNAGSAVKNLDKASGNFAALDIDKTVKKLDQTLGEANALLAKVSDSKGNLNMLLEDRKLYDNMEGISNKLNGILEDFKENPKDYVGFSLININKKKKKDEQKQEDKKK